MIKLQNYTPKVYYNQSRDFQFIGRLYDMVLNSVKTNTDLIYSLPLSADSDEKLLDLMTMTFGFKSKHNYNVKQLKSLCAAFATVIRNKGNITAIQTACNALVSAEGVTEEIYIDNSTETNTLQLYVPQELSDMNLLKDLFNYILPAGMSFNITRTLKVTRESTTTIRESDHIDLKSQKLGADTSQIISTITEATGKADIVNDIWKAHPGSIYTTTIVDTAPTSEQEEGD